MFYQTTLTVSDGAADATPTEYNVVELGFVPDRIEITNRTELNTMIWTKNLEDGHYYLRSEAGTLTKPTTGGPTLIDGSSKQALLGEATLRSFGFYLGKITDLTDIAAEVLDITVYREDDI